MVKPRFIRQNDTFSSIGQLLDKCKKPAYASSKSSSFSTIISILYFFGMPILRFISARLARYSLFTWRFRWARHDFGIVMIIAIAGLLLIHNSHHCAKMASLKATRQLSWRHASVYFYALLLAASENIMPSCWPSSCTIFWSSREFIIFRNLRYITW